MPDYASSAASHSDRRSQLAATARAPESPRSIETLSLPTPRFERSRLSLYGSDGPSVSSEKEEDAKSAEMEMEKEPGPSQPPKPKPELPPSTETVPISPSPPPPPPSRAKPQGPKNMNAQSSSALTRPNLNERVPTAQALINYYESSAPPPASHRVQAQTNHHLRPYPIKEDPLPPLPKASQRTSPLRDSFRDLMSLFGMKGKHKSGGKKHTEVIRSGDTNGQSSTQSAQDKAKQPRDGRINGNILRHGPLLYQEQGENNIWNLCDASLELRPPKLVLYWHTPSGKPAIHTISLATCTDVSSVAANQINPLISPKSNEDYPNVFVLSFQDGRVERLSASSVKNRGSWVSATWDVILSTKQPAGQSEKSYNSGSPNSQLIPKAPLRVVNGSHVTALSSERNSAPSSVVSQSNHTPITSPRRPNNGQGQENDSAHGVSNSKSIKSLGQRSLVRERLASLKCQQAEENAEIPLDGTRSRSVIMSPRKTGSRSFARVATQAALTQNLVPSPAVLSASSEYEETDTPEQCTNFSVVERYLCQLDEAQPIGTPISRTPLHIQAPTPQRIHETSSILLPGHKDLLEPPSPNGSEHIKIPSVDTSPVQLDEETKNSLAQIAPGFQSIDKKLDRLRDDNDAGIAELGVKIDGLRHSIAESRPVPAEGVGLGLGISLLPPEPSGILDAIQSLLRTHTCDTGAVDGVLLSIRAKIEELVEQHSPLAADIALVKEKLDALMLPKDDEKEGEKEAEVEPSLSPRTITYANLGRRSPKTDVPPSDSGGANDKPKDSQAPHQDRDQPSAPSGPPVHEKIDELLELCKSLASATAAIAEKQESSDLAVSTAALPPTVPDNSAELAAILAHVEQETKAREARVQQQGDTMRYLSELNAWLEKFVNDGTNQIMAVSGKVEQLCQDLLPEQPAEPEQTSTPGGTSVRALLGEIRQLLDQKNKERDELHGLLRNLVEIVREDLRVNAEVRETLASESLCSLIERHRQEQEALLQAVARDLSEDIRGERLRFVEAMKEATTVNIQMHVNEFKKALTKEALVTTQDVGRLREERKNLEHELSDMFALKAKYSPGLESLAVYPGQHGQHLAPTPPSRDQYVGRRPLPVPTPMPHHVPQWA